MAISSYDLKNLKACANSLDISETQLAELAGTQYLENISAAEGRALTRKLEQIEADRTQPPAGDTPAPTGWSNASRARRGEHGHPLGALAERNGGRSIYRDHLTGGRVEIWDNE